MILPGDREFELVRITYRPDRTLGVLTRRGVPAFTTIEDPWLMNARNVSCIPCGLYTAAKYRSPKNGMVWMLCDVPERSGIQIHVANTAEDVQGCIGIGTGWSLEGWITGSSTALDRFHAITKMFDSIKVRVRNAEPSQNGMLKS